MIEETSRNVCWLMTIFAAFYSFGHGLAAIVEKDGRWAVMSLMASSMSLMVSTFLRRPK